MSRGGRRSLLFLGSSAIALGMVSIAAGIAGMASAGGGGTSGAGSPIASSGPSASATTTPAAPTVTATPPSTPTAAPSTVPDLTALAGGCRTIPGGTVPAFLRFDGRFSSGSDTDPRTGKKTFVVLAGLGASPLDRTAPFSFAAALLPTGAHAPAGRRAIDGLGTVQLWFSSDLSGDHKGIRRFHDGRWTMRTDEAADTLTFRLSTTEIRFYWSGLQQGERFAFVSAAAGGCDALGVDAVRAPGG